MIVNGPPVAAYRGLQESYSEARWDFHKRPLGFSKAIAAGLRMARFDWVYLLNNDVALDPGALEALFSVLAIREGIAPPTINYDTPDPECDLDYVPNTAREGDIRMAISNSFGFGGTNATLLFRRF